MHQLHPVISLPGRERIIYPFGEKQIVHATAEETGGAMGIFEGFVAPGHGVHWHTHTREDEVFRVIEGRFRFWCGDHSEEGGPGTTIVGPRNIPHRWVNVGESEGRLLFVVTPGGFERFFSEVAGLTQISPEIVGAIERRYGSYRNDELPL
jgi:quercetin dioxygenase-like cupin family protein